MESFIKLKLPNLSANLGNNSTKILIKNQCLKT